MTGKPKGTKAKGAAGKPQGKPAPATKGGGTTRKPSRAADAAGRPWEAETPAAKLCRAADASGIGLDAFLTHPEAVKAAGVRPKEVTPETIREARRLDALWNRDQRERLARLENVIRAEHRVLSEVRSQPRSVTTVALNIGARVRACGVLLDGMLERGMIRQVKGVYLPAKR
jgi:hypothetical protein